MSGTKVVKPLKALLEWSKENHAAMAEARRAYAKAAKKTA